MAASLVVSTFTTHTLPARPTVSEPPPLTTMLLIRSRVLLIASTVPKAVTVLLVILAAVSLVSMTVPAVAPMPAIPPRARPPAF